MNTLKPLHGSYKEKKAKAEAERDYYAKMVQEKGRDLQRTSSAATEAQARMLEHGQAQEAIIISILGGFGSGLEELKTKLAMQRAEFKMNQQTAAASILQAKMERIEKLREYIEKYHKYHELKIERSRLERGLEKENLPEKDREKMEVKLAKITNDMAEIYDFYGYKNEAELEGFFQSAEAGILKSENPIAFMRDNASEIAASVSDASTGLGHLTKEMVDREIFEPVRDGISQNLQTSDELAATLEREQEVSPQTLTA